MATKIITVAATPPAVSTGADYNKGAPLNAVEFDQNLVNLRAAVDGKAALAGSSSQAFSASALTSTTANIGTGYNAGYNQHINVASGTATFGMGVGDVAKTLITSSSTLTTVRALTGASLELYSNGISAVAIPTSGNVLMGTTTDNGSGAKLQVAGAISVNSSIPLIVNSTNSNANKVQLADAGSTVSYLGASTSTGTLFQVADSAAAIKFSVSSSGGIIATLPTSSAGLPTGAMWRNGNVVNIV